MTRMKRMIAALSMAAMALTALPAQAEIKSLVVAGGCFWCTEAVFLEIKGVTSVASGYSGGHVADPSYYQVCGETTGHAEVVRIEFDPVQITFSELLEVFFATHDPKVMEHARRIVRLVDGRIAEDIRK